MSQDSSPLDFVFGWKDSGGRRETGGDSVSVQADSEAGQADHRGQGDTPARETVGSPADNVADQELANELFEWTEDREQALIDALEAAPEGAVPRVHQQLLEIASALEAKTVGPERAGALLAEVEGYLAQRIAAQQRKPPVADPSFTQTRADKSNALAAWQEAVTALREYLSSGEAVQLKLAFYAAEQAAAFLASSRDALLASEPEWGELDETGSADDDRAGEA